VGKKTLSQILPESLQEFTGKLNENDSAGEWILTPSSNLILTKG